MRGYRNSRYANADQEAGERAQIRYIHLNLNLPFYEIAEIVGVSVHRVHVVLRDDMSYLETRQARRDTILRESVEVKEELIAKLRKLHNG